MGTILHAGHRTPTSMVSSRRQRFVRGQAAWMLTTLVVLTLLDALSLSLFIGASLVGLLTAAELTAPVNVDPAWRSRLRWLVALALLAYGGLVVGHVLDALPSGVV